MTDEQTDWLVISPKQREAARIWMEEDEAKNAFIRSVEPKEKLNEKNAY